MGQGTISQLLKCLKQMSFAYQLSSDISAGQTHPGGIQQGLNVSILRKGLLPQGFFEEVNDDWFLWVLLVVFELGAQYLFNFYRPSRLL